MQVTIEFICLINYQNLKFLKSLTYVLRHIYYHKCFNILCLNKIKKIKN